MRKILYSPGFGAGWVSWNDEGRDEQLFMLEYQPFIERLESDGAIDTDLIERWRTDWAAKFPDKDAPDEGGSVTWRSWKFRAGAVSVSTSTTAASPLSSKARTRVGCDSPDRS